MAGRVRTCEKMTLKREAMLMLFFAALLGGVRESASCGYSYRKYANQLDSGSNMMDILSLDTCQALCNSTCTCLGYSHFRTLGWCFIYTALTGTHTTNTLSDLYLRYDSSQPPPSSLPSIRHLFLQKFLAPSSSTSSTPTLSRTESASCGDNYTVILGQYDTALLIADNSDSYYPLSLDECRKNCSKNCTCLAFDHSIYDTCTIYWNLTGIYSERSSSFVFYLRSDSSTSPLHPPGSPILSTPPSPNPDFFSPSPAPSPKSKGEYALCGYSYTEHKGQLDIAGANINSFSIHFESLDGCRALCNDTCTCLGYGYGRIETYTEVCVIYTTLAGKYKTLPNADFDFYRRYDSSLSSSSAPGSGSIGSTTGGAVAGILVLLLIGGA